MSQARPVVLRRAGGSVAGASTSAATLQPGPTPPEPFIMRIVALDYYMARPLLGLDACWSELEGAPVAQVPVVRVFGATPAGQRACLHLHGAMPYFFVPYPPELATSHNEGEGEAAAEEGIGCRARAEALFRPAALCPLCLLRFPMPAPRKSSRSPPVCAAAGVGVGPGACPECGSGYGAAAAAAAAARRRAGRQRLAARRGRLPPPPAACVCGHTGQGYAILRLPRARDGELVEVGSFLVTGHEALALHSSSRQIEHASAPQHPQPTPPGPRSSGSAWCSTDPGMSAEPRSSCWWAACWEAV